MSDRDRYWHQWFAWHPVNTPDRGLVWLRHVWRARHYPPDIPGAPDPYWIHYATDTAKEGQP